jgi:murein DD-endopeptidase MepM/ murein hydrolase activator NlpD
VAAIQRSLQADHIEKAAYDYQRAVEDKREIVVGLNEFVVTGEPVAVMGSGAHLTADKAGGTSQPVLYVEFRKDGIPVDPGPWWAANEGQKVRG